MTTFSARTRTAPDPLPGPYTKDHVFHEPFVTLGYIAAVTERIGLVTGVIILPQRQTALVAKQAAQVDLLSGGRLRLGVGIGWNWVEYEALGQNFHDRGKRQEEQIALMRELWANDTITYQGTWHRVTKAGLNPRPQRQIPVWFGGFAEAALRRAGRIGDGWIGGASPDQAERLIEQLRGYVREAGRDPAQFGIEGRDQVADSTPDSWRANADRWRELGASHLSLVTMNAGLNTPDDHIDALRRYREALA